MLVFDLSEEKLQELGCNRDFIEKILAHIKLQYSNGRAAVQHMTAE
jgi:hypothetical protein